MRILLLGGNGQIGYELRRSLAPLGDLTLTTRTGDLSDGAITKVLDIYAPATFAPLLDEVQPDVVVNATAYTAVERAEDEPRLAFAANADAPAHLAQQCAERGALLVHYSTDYVFDGAGKAPYREDWPTNPLGVYAESKLRGEQRIQDSGARHLILRTAWVYAKHGNNFLTTMLRLGRERNELRVVADQHGCPTPAWLVADVTAEILKRGVVESGIRHLVTQGETTWCEFAERIFDKALAYGLIDRSPTVLPISTADYPTRARRPPFSVLDTTLLRAEYGLSLPQWEDALTTTLTRPD